MTKYTNYKLNAVVLPTLYNPHLIHQSKLLDEINGIKFLSGSFILAFENPVCMVSTQIAETRIAEICSTSHSFILSSSSSS